MKRSPLLLAWLLLASAIWAQPHFADRCKFFSKIETQRVREGQSQLFKEHGVELFILAAPLPEGVSLKSYADREFKRFSDKGKGEGLQVLLLLTPQNLAWLKAGSGLEGYWVEQLSAIAVEKTRPSLAQGKDVAVLITIDELERLSVSRKNPSLSTRGAWLLYRGGELLGPFSSLPTSWVVVSVAISALMILLGSLRTLDKRALLPLGVMNLANALFLPIGNFSQVLAILFPSLGFIHLINSSGRQTTKGILAGLEAVNKMDS